MSGKWTAEDIPSLDGKTVVVTGANSGIGYEATLKFAEKGAHVVLGCRSSEKAEDAIDSIKKELKDPSLEFIQLDLASLDSVERFATEFKKNHDSLDILVNNAGVMAIPRQETEDGFEKQFGVNHLGHFALTSHLLEALDRGSGPEGSKSRVVTVSSGAHQGGSIKFDDINHENSYGKWDAYSQSKLANLLFAFELDRRLKRYGIEAISLAVHPGYADTDLQRRGPEMEGSKIKLSFMKVANAVIAQSAEKGALPTLYAATSESVEGMEYIGPKGLFGMRGYPGEDETSDKARDEEKAERLWELSEELTGVEYDFGKLESKVES